MSQRHIAWWRVAWRVRGGRDLSIGGECGTMVRFMSGRDFNLAIETSSRCGSVALGRGDELLACEELGRGRHAVELMPAIDAMCREHDIGPREIGEVYLSIGPGSFTGLRIAVTTGKMLARSVGAKLVAVPTLDVVVENAPADATEHVAVMLNAKRGQCFTGLYERRDDRWAALGEAALMTPPEVCERIARPAAIVGDHLPEHDWPADVTVFDEALATPRAEVVWRIGRAMAKGGRFVDPLALAPLYVRLPEAEEVWRQAEGKRQKAKGRS